MVQYGTGAVGYFIGRGASPLTTEAKVDFIEFNDTDPDQLLDYFEERMSKMGIKVILVCSVAMAKDKAVSTLDSFNLFQRRGYQFVGVEYLHDSSRGMGVKFFREKKLSSDSDKQTP